VFSVGNVVTGKGNIVASRKHATQVSAEAIEAYLGVADEPSSVGKSGVTERAAAAAEGIRAHVEAQPPLDSETIAAIEARIVARQAAIGYPGDVGEWLDQSGSPC
jgi:hypothetical protein